jgi:hypothetical protein
MPEPEEDAKAKPRVANPIWMISAFLGVSEVTTGVVTTKSETWIQGMFAVFSIVFPSTVLILFFIVLWKKPYVLYAPRDFSENTDVNVFVNAMRQNVQRGVEVAQSAAASSAAEAVSNLSLGTGETEILVQQVKDKAVETVKHAVALVDLSNFLGHGSTMQFIVSQSSTVTELLDAIYASISGQVAPYNYGLSWLIRIKEADKLLVDIGTGWAMNNGYGNSDMRPLSEVGIYGGTGIEVVRKSAT